MKKIFLLCALVVVTCGANAQKKGTSKSSAKATGKKTLATADGLVAELNKKKDSYKFYLLVPSKEAKGKKDTLMLKEFEDAKTDNNLPAGCTLKPFTAKGQKLYQVNWTEKTLTEIPDKKEDATRTVTQIWNIDNKAQLYSNTQTQTKITEILYLDKLKNASQTSEKLRNEGFTLTVLPDGDLQLQNKTQQNRMTFDPATGQYIAVKGAPQSGSAPPAKKKK